MYKLKSNARSVIGRASAGSILFLALQTGAMELQSRVIVDDDFEQGLVKSETHTIYGEKTGYRLHAPHPGLQAFLAGVDPAGLSGIFLHEGEAASGSKSIRIQNAPEMNLGHLPALSWWLHNEDVILSGTVKISFDLLIPEEKGNNVTLLSRRFGGLNKFHDTGIHSINMALTPGKTRYFKKSVSTTPYRWTRYELTLPIGLEEAPTELIITDGVSEPQRIETTANTLHGIDWIGFLLEGKQDAYLLVDNIHIEVVDEKPKPPTGSALPEPEPDPGYWKAAPAELLDVFPPSTVEVSEDRKGKVDWTSSYYSSGSLWQEDLDERVVFHREMKNQQGENNSYQLRIGRGGQVYSLRGAFGESVPPSYRPGGPMSPWNDEVWQFVGVCQKYNNTLFSRGDIPDDVKERIEVTAFPRLHYFIHNSGAYMEGDLMGLDNLYCPLLAATQVEDDRAYRTVNWGLIPWNTPHRSPLLYYVQTHDLGDGIIELTWVVHNFSVRDDVIFDHLNAPWGGTRPTRLPHHYVSTPDGELMDRVEVHIDREMWENPVSVRETGGWNLSSAGESLDSPSLALVFGQDRHLESELEKMRKGEPYVQFSNSIYRDAGTAGNGTFIGQDWESAPENSHRNYDVAVIIPKFRLRPGETIWYRSYLVMNRKDRAIELSKSLVKHVDYGLLTFEAEETSRVPVYLKNEKVIEGDAGSSPAFKLFSKPVAGTRPLFLVEDATTGQEVITTDLTIFFNKEKLNWDLPEEHPDADYYNNAYAYRLQNHNSKWKRLLGYAYEEKPEGDDYVQLSDLLPPSAFNKPDTYNLDLWVKKN